MGRSPCCIPEGLKKGPWTQEEDEKLIAFVQEHGHGNWRALPKKCGLLRCGKSCRLRWNNYLRPDIKRGLFTHSEEQKILQLHALVGNKWAFIASQLPKRTDNEIKNYWNTVLKKRLEKLGLSTLMAFSSPGMDRTLIVDSTDRRRQDTRIKGMQRQDNVQNKSSSNASNKGSCNSSPSVMSCSHLAQWESARLEAEARLAKESQSGKTHTKPFPFAYTPGHSFSSSTSSTAFSSLSNHTHTNPQSQLPLLSSTCSIPPILPSNPCLIHHASTVIPLSMDSSLSLPSLSAIISMPSSSSAASSSSSTSATNIVASKPMSSLASQESIASALTLGPSGRLSWQTNELSFTTTSSGGGGRASSHSSLISQLLSQIERDDGQEDELQASPREGSGHGFMMMREQEQLNMEATSCIVDLNSTMEERGCKVLNSTMENWPDLIFDVENACSSDVLSSSSNWKGHLVPSPPREEFSHESPSLISLLSCEPFANQHSHSFLKELLWDTTTTLSISSTSIVN